MSTTLNPVENPNQTNVRAPSPEPRHEHAEVTHAAAGEAHEELLPDPRPTTEPTDTASSTKTRRPRGFAAMDRALVTEIARKGGKAAHSAGTAHEFTSDEARAAGRKGGLATHARRAASTPITTTTTPAATPSAPKE